MTAAFLNAAIGQLYGTLGEEKIRSLLKVKDVEPVDLALLKRVIDNAKLYFKVLRELTEASFRAGGRMLAFPPHFYGASKMPILDHLNPEISDIAPFESFHSAWTTYIVEDLNEILPEGFLAIPQTSIGAREVDVRADKIRGMGTNPERGISTSAASHNTGEFPSVFEVFVDYIERGRHITVGAIEILSRANKDRPSERDSFVANAKT